MDPILEALIEQIDRVTALAGAADEPKFAKLKRDLAASSGGSTSGEEPAGGSSEPAGSSNPSGAQSPAGPASASETA